MILNSGAVGGKTFKTSVLPLFIKIEGGGGSIGGGPQVLPRLGARHTGGAAV